MANKDFDIVQALLQRDENVTRDFFYRKCYPLFKSIYDNYHTDCSSCIEFINEIYIHLLLPNKETGICKLEQFKFQSTLFTWLKTVCLFYCYKRYKRKINNNIIISIILISIIITKIASIVPINIATKKKIIDNLHNN